MSVPCPYCGTPTPPLPQPMCIECGKMFDLGFYAAIRKGKIGDYRLLRHLGSGGTGQVFEAEQISMGRRVALKILHPDFVRDAGYVKRFFYEVRMLAKISHPHIITAIEAGVDDEFVFFSTRLEEGHDLSWHLEQGRNFSRREVLRIMRETASALEYCWNEFRMIHRDIKAANLFLTNDGHIKIMDMGISKQISLDHTGTLTVNGMMLGTPNYVSPEQARGLHEVTWRCDMYGLGVTCYELLTGSLPYIAKSVPEVLGMHVDSPVPNPRALNPKIPPPLAQLTMRMMQKEPRRRYASWQAFIRDVDGILENRYIRRSWLTNRYREFALSDPVRLRRIWLAVAFIFTVMILTACIAVLMAKF